MGTLLYNMFGSAAGSTTNFTQDATTDFVAWRFLARDTSPIIKAELFCNTKTGTPGDMGLVITAENGAIPNISAGVPVDVGGGSPTLLTVSAASITNNSRFTGTFTNSFTPTAGTRYWVVAYPISGGTWNASNRYIWRQTHQGSMTDYGDEVAASSTDTGSTWTRVANGSYLSLLTTGDAYLPMMSSCCMDAVTTTDVSDTTNPDERGTAWTLPSNTGAIVHGLRMFLRGSAAAADFSIDAYVGDTAQGSRAVDFSNTEDNTATNEMATLIFPTHFTLTTAGTLRVAVKSTDATDTLRHNVFEFGSQARRESCDLFRDVWYCHRNGGAGAFTDDKTRLYSIMPIVEHYGTGGGGGIIAHRGMVGGMTG